MSASLLPMPITDHMRKASDWFLSLHDQVCLALETIEPEKRFEHTPWKRKDRQCDPDERDNDTGGGIMSMLRGTVFEKAGVHYSHVYGEFSAEFRNHIPGAEQDPRFWACGVSVIIHPLNPHIPAVHMNSRMIVTTKNWFGGGADLTPMLAQRRHQQDPDALLFHQAMKTACNNQKSADYQKFKEWCDRYFYLPHRQEMRGIGGIFFDNLATDDWQQDFAFVQNFGHAFLNVYPEIVKRNQQREWNQKDRDEQMMRRGRYVEFNLLYDRGTLFGLKTGGNIDAILSSMPPFASWP